MNNKSSINNYISSLSVNNNDFSLKNFATDFDRKMLTKEDGELLLKSIINEMSVLQDKLYADNRYRILIILQAMDAAGKDSAIKHVMTGLNPQGVKVTSFKVPSSQELDHDYFWRHYIALPGRGEIGIFNRSHYENVLVTKVHPEYLLNERLPGYDNVSDFNNNFWQTRYKQIVRFEKNLYENGTVIIKLFLHLSKKEQKMRFLERIDNPEKNWKFSTSDVKERKLWDDYQYAYEEMIRETSTDFAPWYVLPADDKWFTRLCMSIVIVESLKKLNLEYPKLNKDQLSDLQTAKSDLLNE